METGEKAPPPMSLRLSREGQALIVRVGRKLGLKRSAVVELALRRLAEVEGVGLEGGAE